jgi:NADH-quinone oxidoreductase subunit A
MLIFGPSVMDQQYLSAFGEILLFIIGGVVFLLVTLLVSRFIRPNRPNAEKLSTYESGEEPVSAAWSQFNIRFYIIALIFLLFEVEIVFLFPWATIFARKELVEQTNGAWGWFTMVEMLIFILILALGLAYAWVNGHLEWIKPDPKPTQVNSPVPRELYQKLNDNFAKSRPADKDDASTAKS